MVKIDCLKNATNTFGPCYQDSFEKQLYEFHWSSPAKLCGGPNIACGQ